MKTKSEILREVFNQPALNKSDDDLYLEAMQLYAEQAIERCAEVAQLKTVINPDTYEETHFEWQKIDEQSILDVKQELK
jgi:hypothetical protein